MYWSTELTSSLDGGCVGVGVSMMMMHHNIKERDPLCRLRRQ
jgi:uncharacterized membrane protein YsdA (DUF1294 family)